MNSATKSFTNKKKVQDDSALLKDVKWKQFYDASLIPTDSYWKSILLDISKGRYPKRVAVDANMVTFGPKRKIQTYRYIDKSPNEIYTDIRQLFTQYLGIFSEEDFKGQSEEISNQFEQFNHVTELNDWRKVKNKKMRENLLNDYVLKVKLERDLNARQARQLAEVLDNAIFHFKTHLPEDITMEEGQILEIDDIVIDDDGFIYNPRYEDIRGENLEIKKSGKDRWIGFLKNLVDDLR